MKHLAIIAAAILAASPVLANGQSGKNGNTSVDVDAVSISEAASGSQAVVIQNSKQAKSQTIRSVGSAVAPSFSSGHPCAYSKVSGSLAIIGGAASGGGQVIDDACMLGQMGYRDAAMRMIASQDSAACVALRASGEIGAASLCTKAEKKAGKSALVASYTASAMDIKGMTKPAGLVACDGLEVRVTASSTPAQRDEAVAFCKATR